MKQLAILFNGLLAYQPAIATPLAPLAAYLEETGYETCVTNHLNTGCQGLRAPDLIIGHSQGGATALRFASRYPEAVVVTFDAVRNPPCPTQSCVNFKTPGYPAVRGANNVTILNTSHITLPLNAALFERVTVSARVADTRTPTRKTSRLLERRRSSTPNAKARSNRTRLPSPARLLHEDARELDDRVPSVAETDAIRVGTDDIWPGADRWPNDALGPLDVDLETICALISRRTPEVCP